MTVSREGDVTDVGRCGQTRTGDFGWTPTLRRDVLFWAPFVSTRPSIYAGDTLAVALRFSIVMLEETMM